MTDRTESFVTTTGLKLNLENLTAPVRIQTGDRDLADVRISGDDDYRKSVTVIYDQAANRLTVSEPKGSGGGASISVNGGSVVVGRGGPQINSFGRGSFAGINIGSVSTGRGSSVISADGNMTVLSGGGRVIVNGVDVTDMASGGSGKPVIPSSIVIHVPTGTDLGVDDCEDVTSSGTGGRVRASVSGTASLKASGVTAAKVKVSGQSDVHLTDSTGPVDLTVRGQSGVVLNGRYGDVELAVSGQSSVTGSGSYGHVSGEVSGQSSVNMSRAASQNVRSSGMSSVQVDAPALQRRTGGDGWDF